MLIDRLKLYPTVLLIVGLISLSEAAILYVPLEYRQISSAIESANEGDTILVNPGNYREDLVIRETLTLSSLYISSGDTAYIDSTLIRGTGDNSVIEIIGPYSPVITGFKIMGGDLSYGGGISVRGNARPKIRRCLITECGSGIAAINGAAPEIENCIIINNGRGNGGHGIYCRGDSNPTITNTLIANCNGSGLYYRNNSNGRLENCIITGNRSQGVKLLDSSPSIVNCIISDNTDEIVGGMYLRSGSEPEVINCTISGNVGDVYGGVVIYQSSPIFSECRIVDNTGGSVGGIKSIAGSTPTFENTLIRGNVGIRQWGGIFCEGGQPIFRGCEISDNVSGQGCAGISINEGMPIFLKCLIYDHYSSNQGGAFYITNSDPSIQNCTIVRNSAEDGGAIYFEGEGTVQIRNTIMWDNNLPNIYMDHGGDQNQWETALSVSYSDIEEDLHSLSTHGDVLVSWKKGNFDADPLFLDPNNEIYQLTDQSPCIDAGSPYSPRDRDGTVSDVGAFYFSQANISLSTDSLIFNGLHSGQIDSLPLEISNLGENLLIVGNLQILPGRSPFSISSPDLPDTIISNSAHRYWVEFAPANHGEYHAMLMIDSNDRRQDRLMVYLSGETLDAHEIKPISPTEFTIKRIYPNPFNSNVILKFVNPLPQFIGIDLVDLNGRIIMNHGSNYFETGIYSLPILLKDISAGTYLLRVKGQYEERFQKIVSIR